MAAITSVVWFFGKRAAWLFLTLWLVFTISFALMALMPGNPFEGERKLPEEIRRNIEAKYGLNQPIASRYLQQLGNALLLDFGPSYKLQDYTVNEVIREGFPVSASLGIFAILIALLFGISAGVISAARRNTMADSGVMAAAVVGIAIPNFVLAALAILVGVFWLRLFPAGGWGTLRQLVLPACCLAAPLAAYIARLTRTGVLDVLHQDYVRTAISKGLSERQVIGKHVLRAGLLPVISFLGPAAAGVLSGSLALERIFNIPGLGSQFVEAAVERDSMRAMGMIMVYTLLLSIMNMLVDITYAVIDPRVKLD